MKLYQSNILLLLSAFLLLFILGCENLRGPTNNDVCGGYQDLKCPDGYVCDYPENSCNEKNIEGLCFKIPEACTEQYEPVCGCDNKTYSNDCKRLMTGVPLAHDGECK
ncbi:MAG: Kazal-type serine protease inhibitor family protein [Thermodesulfobacteriota bacterium]